MCFEKTKEHVMSKDNDDDINDMPADLGMALPWRSDGQLSDYEVCH